MKPAQTHRSLETTLFTMRTHADRELTLVHRVGSRRPELVLMSQRPDRAPHTITIPAACIRQLRAALATVDDDGDILLAANLPPAAPSLPFRRTVDGPAEVTFSRGPVSGRTRP